MWWHKKDNVSKTGLIQAAEVFGYVFLFSRIMANGEAIFPHINKTFGPMMFLTLFCFSVLACGLMVFYRPYMLFVDKKGKEAMELVLSTTKWLGIFALIVIVAVAAMSR
ncbi:MAG: hypothetical protein WCG44_02885 [bacterium]